MPGRILAGLVLTLFIVTALFVAVSWRVEISPVEAPTRAFDATLVARGATLARIGGCAACHTAPEGKPYAGGYPLETPFGTIYGTNITPDAETGIGRWPVEAFVRALREGVDRKGRHLYPAFPYNHFTLASDDDLHALYAYMMTREPVRMETPPNKLVFPLNVRMLLAGWKMLFFEEQRFRSDPNRDNEWNRGAYLTVGLGHCGACHTPRNFLGAEKREPFLGGGEAEGWHAPALNGSSPAPVPWTAESIFRYLRDGADGVHGVAVGPMAPVAHSLSAVPEQEVRAIAVYVASVMGEPTTGRQEQAKNALARTAAAPPDVGAQTGTPRRSSEANLQAGAVLYAATCGGCHVEERHVIGAPSANAMHLALSSAVALPTAQNLIRFILQGIAPPDGEQGAFMPGFAGILNDDQVAALVTHVRATQTDLPAWKDVKDEVRRVRSAVNASHVSDLR
jgi:mono/diheme cytochrome c family protein